MKYWAHRQQTDKVNAGVAKLADALALGASGVILGGSSPLPGTFFRHLNNRLESWSEAGSRASTPVRDL